MSPALGEVINTATGRYEMRGDKAVVQGGLELEPCGQVKPSANVRFGSYGQLSQDREAQCVTEQSPSRQVVHTCLELTTQASAHTCTCTSVHHTSPCTHTQAYHTPQCAHTPHPDVRAHITLHPSSALLDKLCSTLVMTNSSRPYGNQLSNVFSGLCRQGNDHFKHFPWQICHILAA